MTNDNNNGDVAINIEALLEGAEAAATNECCIYRVPFGIRKLNEDAYTPEVVSIGPFHNGHPRLQNMEKQKLIYCKAFLQRTQTTSDKWFSEIQEMEPQFRRCYSHTLGKFSKEELLRIIFVDCGFILELFYRADGPVSSEDTCLSKPWLISTITYDLLLLENQIPFFVLEKLFNLSFSSRTGTDNFPSFLQLAFAFFQEFNRSNLSSGDINGISHFTDLIRTFHLQHPLPIRTDNSKIVKHFPSATELSEAGVKFKVLEKERCLLKLDFSEGVLQIPQLVVEDRTEVLFRNMVALEQCHYPYRSNITTDYIDFLDFLVNTNRDVDILVRNEVLLNWLGDTDSVATLINGLMKNITLVNASPHYLLISENLNAFHRNPCRKLKSTQARLL